MPQTQALNPGFVQSLETTNKLWPSIKNDSILKLIAKVTLIVFSFGTIFIATIAYDLIRKFISGFRPAKIEYPVLTGTDKYMKYAKRIFEGVKGVIGAITYIPDTTAQLFYDHQSPYNYIGKTAGFVLSTTALLAVMGGITVPKIQIKGQAMNSAPIGALKGALIGALLNGYGLCSRPLENTFRNVKEAIWPETDDIE